MFSVLALTGLTLAGCGESDAEKQAEIQKALQAGSAITISQIIQQANEKPCESIYLFNHADPENKQDVSLLNVKCDQVDIPETFVVQPPTPEQQAAAAAAAEQQAQPAGN